MFSNCVLFFSVCLLIIVSFFLFDILNSLELFTVSSVILFDSFFSFSSFIIVLFTIFFIIEIFLWLNFVSLNFLFDSLSFVSLTIFFEILSVWFIVKLFIESLNFFSFFTEYDSFFDKLIVFCWLIELLFNASSTLVSLIELFNTFLFWSRIILNLSLLFEIVWLFKFKVLFFVLFGILLFCNKLIEESLFWTLTFKLEFLNSVWLKKWFCSELFDLFKFNWLLFLS